MRATHIPKAKSSFLSFDRLLRRRAGLPAMFMLAAFSSSVSLWAQSTWIGTSGSWSSDFNWDPAIVPVSDFATQLIFNAIDADTYTVTNDVGTGTFNLNRLTVNNTGTGTVTIASISNANSLTFGGSNSTLDITGTTIFTGLMAGSATITKTGSGTFIHDSNNTGFTGTLIIDQGAFINRATSTMGQVTNFNPVSIIVNDGSTYQFGAATVGNPNLPNTTYITVNTGGVVNWQEGEDFGGFHLHGGTINLQQGTANTLGSTVQNWTSGTLTGGNFVIGGTTAIEKTSPGTVAITGNVAITNGVGGIRIYDGTISMANAVNLGNTSITLGDAAGGTSGRLLYAGATASRVGSFAINSGSGVIDIESSTTTLTLTDAFSGPGNLSKTGAGKLQFNGALNGTGTFAANAGTLQVQPIATQSSFAVAPGAVLAVNSGAGTLSLSTPGLSFGGSNATLQFDLDTNAVTTSPLMVVNLPNGLNFSGTPTIRLTNLQGFSNGTYMLINYDGDPIASGFNLALPGRTLGNLVYDTTNTRIDVTISGTDTLKWTGSVDGNWDVGTAAGVGGTNNWKLAAAGSATNFIDTDTVIFDDSATNRTIHLISEVKPFSIAVTAAGDYTFDGSGKLSGTTTLTKSGTGTLVLGTDNDYSGGTIVIEGTVQLGNGGTSGSVVGTITLNGGALAFNRSDDLSFTNTVEVNGSGSIIQNGAGLVTFPNPFPVGTNTVTFGGFGNLLLASTLSGSGTVNKTGPGTLTLLANNSFSGIFNVNGGTVLLDDLGAGGDLNAASINVGNGGTFIFGATGNTDLPDTTIVTANEGGLFRLEQGENYGGFILNGGEYRFSGSRTGVNSTAVTTVTDSIVYDLRSGTITTDFINSGAGGGLNQNGGGILVKTTAGTVTVSGRVTFQNTLPVFIKEGTLALNGNNVPAGGSVPLTLGDVSTTGTLTVNGSSDASTIRPVTLEAGGGVFEITEAEMGLLLAGTVSGPGSLTKKGEGSLILSSANDYTGGTIVVAGVLEANNAFGSATGTGPVTILGTLTGDGGIATDPGKDIVLNGVFLPGSSIIPIGSDFNLTAGIGGHTTFGASSIASFDLWTTLGGDLSGDPTAADLLIVNGSFTITTGATLALTNPNLLTFQSGDVFRLFDWTGVDTLTGTWTTIDATALNLGETLTVDTTNLYTAGTVAIVTVPEPTAAVLVAFGLAATTLRRRRRLL